MQDQSESLSSSPTSQRLPSLFKARDFRVGSWNLQGGLHNGNDFDRVIGDLVERKVHVACLQETHRKDSNPVHRESGKVFCLEDSPKTPVHQRYGLGFFLSKSLEPYYKDHKLVSNRIAVLRLECPYRGDLISHRRKSNTICIVNVYAPTSQFANKCPEERSGFFELLQKTVSECNRKCIMVIVAGDCNAKLGARKEDGEKEAFMGNYGKGTRNHNGGYLATFMNNQNMYASNTHFRHSMRHRTTWTG